MAQDGSGVIAGQDAIEAPIEAIDQLGKVVRIPRDEWRTNVLPVLLKESWENPEQLYTVIVNSLNQGFMAELAEAAAQLHATDTIPGRGTCMLAIVLSGTGQRDAAQALLEGFGAKHGDDGSVLVNLAKIYADKGEMAKAQAMLSHALEVEPNHDAGLAWHVQMEQERGGDAAAKAALERLAALPASWRAQLWLGRGELAADDVAEARALYEEALERAPKPIPQDLLAQMSGDLGAKGALRELIELTAPHFVPEYHGIVVGNNLIKALVDTGNLAPAEQVKAALWDLRRPDWKDALAFWDGEIARVRLANVEAGGAATMQMGMLRVDGPVWLPAGSPGRGLFAAKPVGAPTVTFVGGTAEAPESPTDAQVQMADNLGRMTRALPLYFAEQVEMRTAAAGRAMIPWAVAPASGFVVSGQRWPDEAAVQTVLGVENASDYVVTVHVDGEVEPWTAELAFIRTSDGTRIGELQAEFAPESPEVGLAELSDEVVELLSVLGPATRSERYEVPGPEAFGSYLLRLEQLLAVRCATMPGVAPEFLNGEGAILEGELALCAAEPRNVPARLLLDATVKALERIRPAVVEDFSARLEGLKNAFPIDGVDGIGV